MTRDELVEELQRCPVNSEVVIVGHVRTWLSHGQYQNSTPEMTIDRISTIPKIVIEAVE